MSYGKMCTWALVDKSANCCPPFISPTLKHGNHPREECRPQPARHASTTTAPHPSTACTPSCNPPTTFHSPLASQLTCPPANHLHPTARSRSVATSSSGAPATPAAGCTTLSQTRGVTTRTRSLRSHDGLQHLRDFGPHAG